MGGRGSGGCSRAGPGPRGADPTPATRVPAESETPRAPLTAAAGRPSRCPPPRRAAAPRPPLSPPLCAAPRPWGAAAAPPSTAGSGRPLCRAPRPPCPRAPAGPSCPPARGRRRCVYMRGGIRTADSGPRPALLFLKSLSASRHWLRSGRVTRGAGPSASARPHCLLRPRSPRGPGPAPLFGGSRAIVLPDRPGQRRGKERSCSRGRAARCSPHGPAVTGAPPAGGPTLGGPCPSTGAGGRCRAGEGRPRRSRRRT